MGRLEICRDELHGLLKEEKLVGATLLILANKQDLQGALPASEIKKVCSSPLVTDCHALEHLPIALRQMAAFQRGSACQTRQSMCLAQRTAGRRWPSQCSEACGLTGQDTQVLELDSCGRRHWRILGCSAVTGLGLLEGF